MLKITALFVVLSGAALAQSANAPGGIPIAAPPGTNLFLVPHAPMCQTEDALKTALALLKGGNVAAVLSMGTCGAGSAPIKATLIERDGMLLPWFRVAASLDSGTAIVWVRGADTRTTESDALTGHPLSY